MLDNFPKKYIILIAVLAIFSVVLSSSLSDTSEDHNVYEEIVDATLTPQYEFGFNINAYNVVHDTVKSGDSFGGILERYKMSYPDIYNIVEKTKETYDLSRIGVGKPFTLLRTNDSLQEPQCFIYQPNKLEYVVIQLDDENAPYVEQRQITIETKVAAGVISSSLSETMDGLGLPYQLINDMSDIYAWTIDFFRLYEGDEFKIIYDQRMIDDSVYGGIDKIQAALFKHRGREFYAFNYDGVPRAEFSTTYFDEEAGSLQRTFLTSPVQFSSISSRYNLSRRIALYGNKVRPHKGTDFAAPMGSEILATADGIVEKSSYTGGNGNYVKIKHNRTYSTQYLHMKKRNVNVGQVVKQGDVIGYVGMTGNTSGPHVCYRFWKNGVQVDPFKEKLPKSKNVPANLIEHYKTFISPLKKRLDNIPMPREKSAVLASNTI